MVGGGGEATMAGSRVVVNWLKGWYMYSCRPQMPAVPSPVILMRLCVIAVCVCVCVCVFVCASARTHVMRGCHVGL